MSQADSSRATAAASPRAMRHLAPVEPARPVLDRRAQSFVPVYVELFRSTPDARGHAGYGLSGSVAVFYSVIVQLQGTPADGRRQTRAEIDGRERFSARTVGAGDLLRMYGWSYDEIQSWAETCSAAHACHHCKRAHPLLRIERRVGKRNRYSLVRCQDLADDACLPLDAVAPEKRKPTGAADPARRKPPEVEPLLLFEHDPTLGLSPRVPACTSEDRTGTLGESPRVFPETMSPGPPGYDSAVPAAEPAPRIAIDEAKMMVLRGFAALQGVAAPDDALTVIARCVSEPEGLLEALILTIAMASLEHSPITVAIAQTAMAARTTQPSASEVVRDEDWARDRVLELARRREPQTTSARAARVRDEFYAQCVKQAGGDRRQASALLEQILTDPRICGKPGRDGPTKPIALLRDGLRNGWIWTAAHEDDGTSALARAFDRLAPGDRDEILRIFQDSQAGAPIDIARLRRHHVTSRAMIDYLKRRFSGS